MPESSSSSSSSYSNSTSSSSSSSSSSSDSSSSSQSSSSLSSQSSSSSTNVVPDIPTSGDIISAVSTRWNDDKMEAYLLTKRLGSVEDGEDFPPIQFGDEFARGTPFPRCLIDVGTGIPSGGTTNKTQNGKQIRHQMYDTPFQFRVFAKTLDESEEIAKVMARSIERADLPVCGSQSFVKLFRPTLPILLKESDEIYSTTVRYTIRTDAETVL